MTSDLNLLSYLGLAVASLIGGAFGAYLKRRGENLATHADLDKLIEQMSAVTETTENIKAAISDDVWDRQKQWEMRRDAVFEAVSTLGELANALYGLHSVHSCPMPEREDLKAYMSSERRDKAMSFDTCNARIYRAMFLTRLVVGEQLGMALVECVNEMRSITLKILSGDTAHFMKPESKEILAEKLQNVILAARKELKIEIAA
jgi:hypothetical protein